MYTTVTGNSVQEAKQWLCKNELVAIPTETVYGLAANAFNAEAVQKIFSVKQRPLSNPLILHVANKDTLQALVTHLPDTAVELLKAFSPGPLTLLLNKNAKVPSVVNAGLDKVAVRIPNHQLTLNLLENLSFPLAAPSANPFGYISPTSAEHVYFQLNTKIPYILDGGFCSNGVESTVVGFNNDTPVIYRLGMITKEDIESVCGVCEINKNHVVTESPGMLPYHYSPHTPLIITDNIQEALQNYPLQNTGIITVSSLINNVPVSNQRCLSLSGNINEAARNLYRYLIELDRLQLSVIIAERLPDKGLGTTLNERLEKAAAKNILK
ncbi:MAG: threonylcarbamoyl-AMP synthase [Chitinophaga sp.]|jgi:L-threonylcarbamoyladenylate synthase|nr:threonylcarbamoyl-AMP synthase [Chitinophaga sp.]